MVTIGNSIERFDWTEFVLLVWKLQFSGFFDTEISATSTTTLDKNERFGNNSRICVIRRKHWRTVHSPNVWQLCWIFILHQIAKFTLEIEFATQWMPTCSSRLIQNSFVLSETLMCASTISVISKIIWNENNVQQNLWGLNIHVSVIHIWYSSYLALQKCNDYFKWQE